MNELDVGDRVYMTEYFQSEVINKNKSLYIDFYYKVQELIDLKLTKDGQNLEKKQ